MLFQKKAGWILQARKPSPGVQPDLLNLIVYVAAILLTQATFNLPANVWRMGLHRVRPAMVGMSS